MEIRLFVENDIEDVLELHFLAMKERNCLICTPDLEEDLKNITAYYSGSRGHFCIALSSGGVVGIGAVESEDQVHAVLKHLFVTKPYRGQQLGSRILSFLLEESKNKNHQTIGAHTMEAMHAAQGLLKKHGFKAVKRYKRDGQDHVYFQK